MSRTNSFKSPPKRFHPRGLTIIYEDSDILVVEKASGLLTIGTERVKENTAYHLLSNYVKKGNHKSRKRIFIVHRLDRDTSGLIVFAKSKSAQSYLQDNWSAFTKKYTGVVQGILPEKEGLITSYLAENSAHRMYSVDDPKEGKLAKTAYRVVRETKRFTLLEIELLTGRKNQIRVHFAEKGFPLVGDKTYGEKKSGFKQLALHATSLTIKHPFSKEEMSFDSRPPSYFKQLMGSGSEKENPSAKKR